MNKLKVIYKFKNMENEMCHCCCTNCMFTIIFLPCPFLYSSSHIAFTHSFKTFINKM